VAQTRLSGQLIRSSSVSASAIVGTVASASRAQTSSIALDVNYANVSNKPTLISASSQVSYTGLSNIPTGIVSGTAQVTALLPAGIVSSSGQVSYTGLSNVPTGIVSASSQVSYTGLSNVPVGIVSGAAQVKSLLPAGTVSSSGQVSYTGLSNIPSGILSSSTQINNLSGVSSSFATSASRAVTSSFAISASWAPADGFPYNGTTTPAVITGSLIITGSLLTHTYALITSSLGNASGSMSINLTNANYFTAVASASTTWTFNNPPTNRSVGFVLLLVSGGAVTQTWPATVRWPNGSAPVLTPSGGVDVLTFITDDTGTNWRGVLSMVNSQ
jgi:hypothetical protein